MPASALPKVVIVVVDYGGGAMTERCLDRLARTSYAGNLRTIVVDNASNDAPLDPTRRWSDVTVLSPGQNLGFGGACNFAMDHAADADVVALVNNDVEVDPDWLDPLAQVLATEPSVSAVVPKILLAGKYIEVRMRAPASVAVDDWRPLGVRLSGIRSDGVDVWASSHFASGFWGPETAIDTADHPKFQWTSGDARVLVPADRDDATIEFRVQAASPKALALSAAGGEQVAAVDAPPVVVRLERSGPVADVVNSAGLELNAQLEASDRGYLELDRGQFNAREEVFGWSGACVCLRASAVRELGAFDERLFLYYEDVDLSWRLRIAGWRTMYEPRSVVRHRHSATTASHHALVRHLSERNRLVVVTKNAPLGQAVQTTSDAVYTFVATFVRDVARRAIRGRRPQLAEPVRQARVLAGYAKMIPGTARRRRAVPARVSDRRQVVERAVKPSAAADGRSAGAHARSRLPRRRRARGS